MRRLMTSLFGMLIMVSLVCAEDSAVIKSAIAISLQENLTALQDEDMEGVMKTIHTQSPVYIPTQETCRTLFPYYDLKYELLDFEFIGMTGEYAIGRFRQKTEKISGPAFQNNIVDTVCVFRKEGDEWKFWNQVIIDVGYV